jgi:hypothetical protein
MWLNTVTLIHLKTFFFTINNLRSLSPFLLGIWTFLRPNTSLVHIWAGTRPSRCNNSIVTTILASVRPSYSKNATTRLPLDGLPWIFVLYDYIKINQDIQVWLKSDRNNRHYTWDQSSVTDDLGSKPDRKYARRRDRQSYIGRIK